MADRPTDIIDYVQDFVDQLVGHSALRAAWAGLRFVEDLSGLQPEKRITEVKLMAKYNEVALAQAAKTGQERQEGTAARLLTN